MKFALLVGCLLAGCAANTVPIQSEPEQSEESETAPQMSFSVNSYRVVLIKVDQDVNWNDMQVKGCANGVGFDDGQARAGDAYDGCVQDESIHIIHTPTNILVFTHTFG